MINLTYKRNKMNRSHKFKSPTQNVQQRQQRFQQPNIRIGLLTILTAIIANINAAEASQDLLPHICDSVECPLLPDIVCPDDSDIRDSKLLPAAAALLSPMASTATETISASWDVTTAAPAVAPASISLFNNSSDFINQSIFAQCCLSKKCICKTCYIPDCHDEKKVVIELIPESMDTPGHCCGQYDCQQAPNCTEVVNTENYWLTDCQRCKCYNGERICHQSCDEGMRKSNAICNSKTLNTFFENGEVWKDGCYECECVNGEEKCVMPFCRSVNCPTYRQVLRKDSCCPICWPKGIPMQNGDEDYDDDDGDGDDDEDSAGKHIYDDEDDEPITPLRKNSADNYASGYEIDTLLPDIKFEKVNTTSTKTNSNEVFVNVTCKTTETPAKTVHTKLVAANPTTTIAATSTTPVATVWEIFAPNTTTSTTEKPESIPPCMIENINNNEDSASATYQIYPKMVPTTDQSYLYYTIIGVLGTVVVILAVWNVHLRAKQRSYRPVSNFDDNFNKMSSNIKKMNDYV